MNMYIAQARGGRFEIVESLGAIDPQERLVGTPVPRRLSRRHARPPTHHQKGRTNMLLATTQVEDFDRFMEVFSTTGAEKRQRARFARARSSSATPPRTIASGWSSTGTRQGWQSFVSDPEVPPIMKEAGHKGEAAGRAVRRPCDA